MCFSAQASFGAAVALSTIGAASLRAAPSRRYLAFASIPLLFAAQQACEGALWLSLERAPFHVGGTPLARAFLFFALLVWPAWVPLSLWLVEARRGRRAALACMAFSGALLGAWLVGCATLRDANACIAFGNLYYWVQIDAPLRHVVLLPYLALVAAPLVVSSLRGTTWLAAATIASAALAGWLYRAGFVSVWCFFAAALSGVVAIILLRARRPRTPPAERRASSSPCSPLPPPSPRSCTSPESSAGA
jgi:hypothetical protein